VRFFTRLSILALLSITMSFGFVGCGPSYMSEEDAMEQEVDDTSDEIDDGGMPTEE
jgi:hypothetical protein